MTEKPRCSGGVTWGSWGRKRPCEKPATTTDADGRAWCGTHSPEAVEARKARSQARFKARVDATMASLERLDAKESALALMVEALRSAAANMDTQAMRALEAAQSAGLVPAEPGAGAGKEPQ